MTTRKKIGIILLVSGIAILLLTTLVVMLSMLQLGASGGSIPFQLLVPLGALIASAAMFLFITPGLRRLQPSAEELLATDSRPPIIFLRSYRDEAMVEPARSEARTGSEALAYKAAPRVRVEVGLALALSSVGPVIAIGKPGEKLPQLGASRTYVSNEEWQSKISSWMERCGLVVMLVYTPTEGTQWEIMHARATLDPSRFVLYFPGTPAIREAVFSSYRQQLSEMLQHSMPRGMSSAAFLHFDKDWTPQAITNLADLMEILNPAYKTLPFRKKVGPVRFAMFASLFLGLGLELIYVLYRGYVMINQ